MSYLLRKRSAGWRGQEGVASDEGQRVQVVSYLLPRSSTYQLTTVPFDRVESVFSPFMKLTDRLLAVTICNTIMVRIPDFLHIVNFITFLYSLLHAQVYPQLRLSRSLLLSPSVS